MLFSKVFQNVWVKKNRLIGRFFQDLRELVFASTCTGRYSTALGLESLK
jgi:hypothetical protein